GPRLERPPQALGQLRAGAPQSGRRASRARRHMSMLAGGGKRSATAVLRSASGSAERLHLALAAKLGSLSAPATALALRVVEMAPAAGTQAILGEDPGERRRERLAEAVRQVRAAAGRDSVLRVLDVDPDSRVPERWAALAPYNEQGGR
ncbi:MAG: hypothetical protein KDB46_13030, partial [Solirubrobacterales bacterium]|nr:hypothetical protein [Solirubrobacterales bacterium]